MHGEIGTATHLHTALAMGADPPPAPHQKHRAEEIRLDAERVEAVDIAGRIDPVEQTWERDIAHARKNRIAPDHPSNESFESVAFEGFMRVMDREVAQSREERRA